MAAAHYPPESPLSSDHDNNHDDIQTEEWGDFVSAEVPLQGFDTLDDVQRYALGAVAVVLLNEHAQDLNGLSFARTYAATILQALGLREGQQTALLALEPHSDAHIPVIKQCTSLVGDDAARFAALQAMLALALVTGNYDARSRAFLSAVANTFAIPLRALAAVELAVAIQLSQQASIHADNNLNHSQTADPPTSPAPPTVDELLIARRKKKMRYRKAAKITGITLVGGMLFGLTGGLIAPGLLTALAGVGVASAAGLAASGTVASGAVVGGLFGVAGAGFTVKKARNRVSTSLEEFDFERPDDPRVVEVRKRKAERERRKMEKLIAARLKEEAEANACLAIEGAPPSASAKPFDPEKELPRPTPQEPSDGEGDDEESQPKKHGFFSGSYKNKKKREKLKVGAHGLKAAGEIPSLHICICVPAWLTEKSFGAALDQFEPALKQELPCSQHIALRWESRRLYEMGLAFAKFWASKATVTTLQQAYPHVVAAASTVAGAVAFAFAMPLTIMSCMDYVDNPWSILVSRSNGAGDELADVLVERSYGQRPVTLFGYSIGARVIFKCLESLASRGALGIVDNVFVMGAAVTADPERWKKIRPVVAGRIVNAYGSHDMALACFHRGCGHGVYISGLRRVEVEGVENLNMAYLGIEGHRELKDCVPRVMKAMGIGLGYISMPPARLVRRGGRTKGRGARSDSPVCEEPERLGKSPDNSHCNSPVEGCRNGNSNLENMRKDSFWDSNSPENNTREERLLVDDDLTLPPHLAQPDLSNSLGISGDSLEVSAVGIDTEKCKKKKSKSWLSWASSAGRSKPKSKKEMSLVSPDEIPVEVIQTRVGAEALTLDQELERNEDEGMQLEVGKRFSSDVNVNAVNQSVYAEDYIGVANDIDGVSDIDDIVSLGNEEDEVNEEFDWEKQRRIWEEQERQMQERGFADSASEIEMRNKMILGIGIEVAGRRICPFLKQDADLPVAQVEEMFTNCLEDQHGISIRVYEHEKRTKSVSINMLKHDEQYPKFLGELQLQLSEKAVKGKLRVAVMMWAEENGDICVEAEERLPDGKVGNQSELRVPRSELCTMAERTRLEAAERKRIEAQLQKEMRARAVPDMLSLPAPEDDTSKQSNEADQEE